jgi:2'-5' RNA ligase
VAEQSIRCFVAVNLPPFIKENLGRIQEELRKAQADVSWVKPENIHLTLKFLGGIGEKRVERVKEVLANAVAMAGSFDIQLEGLGVFPGIKSPRVVWVGVKETPAALIELQKAVDEGLAQIGFPKEGRKFSPHFTLGRVRSPRNVEALRQALTEVKTEGLEAVKIESLELMQSQLSPKGSTYSVLQKFYLKLSEP